jgi:hypothetical protein
MEIIKYDLEVHYMDMMIQFVKCARKKMNLPHISYVIVRP